MPKPRSSGYERTFCRSWKDRVIASIIVWAVVAIVLGIGHTVGIMIGGAG